MRAVNKVGVIGAGTMGGGITMALINAGLPVVLLESTQEALERGLATIRRNYQGALQQGHADRGGARKAPGADQPDPRVRAPARGGSGHRGGVRDLEVKEQVFRKLDAVAQARGNPRLQHLGAGPERDRRLHPAAAGRDRPAFLQSRQPHAPAGGRARARPPQGMCWRAPWRSPSGSARSRSSPGCATALSATA